jgi:hypothetical protein
MSAPQSAPAFTLDHINGYPVSLSDYRGRIVVILFGGKNSSEQTRQIARTLGARYSRDQLPIISILDMSGVPRLMQGIIKGQIQKAHQEAVQEMLRDVQADGVPAPADPARAICMLPDWDGKVIASFGVSGVDRQAVAVLVDGEGYIRGYGAGAQGGEQILAAFGG